MNTRRIVAAGSVTALAAASAFALSVNSASAEPLSAEIDNALQAMEQHLDPQMLEALTEELGISADEAKQRLAMESVASNIQSDLDSRSDFAGLWLNEDSSEIFVATTGGAVTAAGVTHVTVEHALSDLTAITDELESLGENAYEDNVYGWYIDVTSNDIVVEAATQADGRAFVDMAGIDADMVTIDADVEEPQLFHVTGGDRYDLPMNSWCSVGFAATKNGKPGFTTAGHCGSVGTSLQGGNAAPGRFVDSIFPGKDNAWVSTQTTDLRAQVLTSSGTVAVTDSSVAPIGSNVCRSGATTGWRCGTVQAFNQSVSYAQGTVHGMTRTSACAQGGDSGGAFIAGTSAQGMTSGGSGNCSTGGTTYFYPLNPTLNDFGLQLVTS
ncbi:S1 family peptidase [Natronoglycomyces albus]|uniref:S1 family peptidase n=1 Tax=Natronoglycomyces albus TaxID=2811108 RepID=A0A895XRF0_9ACTN|nr:S1 family peptidase [Natronoglycomyces albus]QSB05919.1 S1 family peptidase [Natronoglycomyces albus]